MPARTTDPSSKTAQHVAYVLLAEFDIDAGASLTHQYPYPTGADKHLLAELMLPEGVHNRSEDWTVFFLNQNASNTITSVFPRHSIDSSISDATATADDKPELIYVLSVVRTKRDAAAKRKAEFKAIALCTQHPYIQIFKPVLSLALDQYILDPSVDCLSRLYDTLNAMDLSLCPCLSPAEKLILRYSDRTDTFAEKFVIAHGDHADGDGHRLHSSDEGSEGSNRKVEAGEMGQDYNRSRATSVTSVSETSSVGRMSTEGGHGRHGDWAKHKRPSFDRGSTASSTNSPKGAGTKSVDSHERKSHGPRDTRYYESSLAWGKVTLPIKIPLSTFKEEVGDYSLIKLIQTFSAPTSSVAGPLHPHLHTNGIMTHPVILLFNAIITEKNVVFLGTNRPAKDVVDFVLAACALGSGGGCYLRGLAERSYPYATLAIRDMIETTTGYIAGVTNPIFENFSTWDILCNIETGKITVNKDIKMPSYSPVLVSPPAFGRPAAVRPDTIVEEDDEHMKSIHMLNGGSAATAKVDYTVRQDTADAAFIEDLLGIINAHYGEPAVRMRVGDYVLRFLRLASLYEEEAFGETRIGYPNVQFGGGEMGSGVGFMDENARARELNPNYQQRIEAWRRTKCYQHFVTDYKHFLQTRAIRGFDVSYQITRLRSARNMSDAETNAIMRALREGVQSYEQVVELLALVPLLTGGLLPITFCLFHPQEAVREAAVDFLNNLKGHRIGDLFIQSLNILHRLAYRRLAQGRTSEPDAARRNTMLAATAFGIPSASLMSGTPSNQSASSLVI